MINDKFVLDVISEHSSSILKVSVITFGCSLMTFSMNHVRSPQLPIYRFLKTNFIPGRIAAGEGRFNSNSEVNINTEVRSIPVTKKGVYFAFKDQGACISLLAIKVSTVAKFYNCFFQIH